MKRLLSLLRSRRGETLVEVLMSMVLFLLIMGTLSGAMGFAAGAQDRAMAMKDHAEAVQQNLRTNSNSTQTSQGEETFSFRAISKDGSQWSSRIIFTVTVDKQQVTVEGAEGFEDATFHIFRRQEGSS